LPAEIEADVGLTAIEIRFTADPVPLRDTVCGLLFAESLKLRVPVRTPVALGENVTDAVQLAPAARVFGLMGHVVLAMNRWSCS
jgi:hypothetical protein